MNLYSLHRDSSGVVVTIETARLDASVADEVKQGLKASLTEASMSVVVDIRRVEFIDSSGIGALVAVRKHLGRDGRLSLANPSPFVLKVLRLIRLEEVLPVMRSHA